MEKVERVQYRGALVVFGAWKGTNQHKIYEELGWESLSELPEMNRLIQKSLTILLHLISEISFHHSNILLKQNHPIPSVNIEPKLTVFQCPFFPDSLKQWNIVITDFDHMPTLASFKPHIRALYRPHFKRIV